MRFIQSLIYLKKLKSILGEQMLRASAFSEFVGEVVKGESL